MFGDFGGKLDPFALEVIDCRIKPALWLKGYHRAALRLRALDGSTSRAKLRDLQDF
jgi:hypothetical protein